MHGISSLVTAELGQIALSDSGTALSEMIERVAGTPSGCRIDLSFAYPNRSQHDSIRSKIRERLLARGIALEEAAITNTIYSHKVQEGVKAFDSIKNIIAIASAKGGVGKSTISVNIACALHQEGARVGLLDADIYGPSIPVMLGANEKPQTLDGKTMEPITAYGIQTISIGYLVAEESAMIWRGPILTQTLTQLLNETNWHDLDYLIVDLPPGTGDAQLTLAQKIPVSGAVVVTTPQEVALRDASKGVTMFNKVHISVLGIVENMSGYVCPHCNHEVAIFSSGGGGRLARRADCELLGRLPLDIAIRKSGDDGVPIVTQDNVIANRYRAIARRLAFLLSRKPREYSGKFPKIVTRK